MRDDISKYNEAAVTIRLETYRIRYINVETILYEYFAALSRGADHRMGQGRASRVLRRHRQLNDGEMGRSFRFSAHWHRDSPRGR